MRQNGQQAMEGNEELVQEWREAAVAAAKAATLLMHMQFKFYYMQERLKEGGSLHRAPL
jgi:hypothetical protein